MTRSLDRLVVQRLALVRFLFTSGVDESRRASPLSAKSILSFHDGVELFLILAAEHLQVNMKTQVNFADYWTSLGASLPAGTQLPSKKAMDRMNKLRVGFKHHGSIPSQADIEQVRGDVTTFLVDATQLVFGVDFHTLDMADLVTDEILSTRLRRAQTKADAGEIVEALADLSVAFDVMIQRFGAPKLSANGYSPFQFKPIRMFHSDSTAEIRQVTGAIEELQHAMRIMAAGIDYHQYARFAMIVPRVYHQVKPDGSDDEYQNVMPELVHAEFGMDEFEFCRQFLIESAIKVATIDFELDLYDRNQTFYARNREVASAGEA
ncbi:hypothetical protein [Streptomyces sp. NRRL B-24484]|uniref:hypothetical protein n=1 Tax=Streptomyces sp. NRRL B-24484 TaxID=1463833 RepID=UPI0004C081EE|nr:hypothetical protein [Streptomyces sp. NRRL B-24484]